MNINYKQSQFELFPGSPGSSNDTEKPRFLLSNLTLSLENVVVICIVMMMAGIFFFSLGVERGKTLVSSDARPAAKITGKTTKAVAKAESKSTVNVLNSQAVAAPAGKENTKTPAVPAAVIPPALPTVVEAAEQKSLDLTGKYTIQVASFKQEKHAQVEADNLKKKGYETLVMDKGKYSIVCVGTFTNKNEAESFSRKIKNQYKDFVVRRL